MATDREVVARPRLVVLHPRPKARRLRLFARLRQVPEPAWALMAWFATWVAAWAVLVMLFEHPTVVLGVNVEPYFEGLGFVAWVIAGIPGGWRLYDDWVGEEEGQIHPSLMCGGRLLHSVLNGILVPYVYAYRILRIAWRAWRSPR